MVYLILSRRPARKSSFRLAQLIIRTQHKVGCTVFAVNQPWQVLLGLKRHAIVVSPKILAKVGSRSLPLQFVCARSESKNRIGRVRALSSPHARRITRNHCQGSLRKKVTRMPTSGRKRIIVHFHHVPEPKAPMSILLPQ